MALAQSAIAAFAGSVPAETTVDPRIGRAIDWVRSRLDGPISLSEAAGVANLSPSRFRHLFVAHLGAEFHAAKAMLLDDALQLGDGGVRVLHGQSTEAH